MKHAPRAEPGQYREPTGERIAAVSRLPRKSAKRQRGTSGPVPQTDTGGRVENTEALERFMVKELGKLTP